MDFVLARGLFVALDGVGDAPVAYDDAAHGAGWLEAARARGLPLLVANPDEGLERHVVCLLVLACWR